MTSSVEWVNNKPKELVSKKKYNPEPSPRNCIHLSDNLKLKELSQCMATSVLILPKLSVLYLHVHK